MFERWNIQLVAAFSDVSLTPRGYGISPANWVEGNTIPSDFLREFESELIKLAGRNRTWTRYLAKKVHTCFVFTLDDFRNGSWHALSFEAEGISSNSVYIRWEKPDLIPMNICRGWESVEKAIRAFEQRENPCMFEASLF